MKFQVFNVEAFLFNVEIFSRIDGQCLHDRPMARTAKGRSEVEVSEEIRQEIADSAKFRRDLRRRTGASTALANLDIRVTP